jgi:hypothetical protein
MYVPGLADVLKVAPLPTGSLAMGVIAAVVSGGSFGFLRLARGR